MVQNNVIVNQRIKNQFISNSFRLTTEARDRRMCISLTVKQYSPSAKEIWDKELFYY